MRSRAKRIEAEEFYYERTQRNQLYLGGKEGQDKVKDLKIGVAGLGGMGSNIAEYLARLGVGELRLADPDTIDVSNINRQVIANINTVGLSKAEASKIEIKNIATDVKLKVFTEGITEECVDEFVSGCDFIVDEIDVFPIDAHYILHKKCRELGIPVYSAYVIGLGVNFYKFHGDEFKFEDLLSTDKTSDSGRLDDIVHAFISDPPSYLQNGNIEEFKKTCLEHGVPIFGPSCLVGHSVVVTRILCDFLGSNILGVEVPKTPVMPEYLNIDLMTLELKKKKFTG